MIKLIDKCKKCGCTSLEHKYCYNNKFYRHIDDKRKMKQNLKIIRLHRSGYLQYYIFSLNNLIKKTFLTYLDKLLREKNQKQFISMIGLLMS